MVIERTQYFQIDKFIEKFKKLVAYTSILLLVWNIYSTLLSSIEQINSICQICMSLLFLKN